MADVEERVQRAERGGADEIALLLHDPAQEVLEALLRNPSLSEEHLLILLSRKNLPEELLKAVAGHRKLAESQRVKAALVLNPKTPRLVSLKLMKYLYLFDLVRVSLQPAVPTEIKRLAENQVIGRLKQLPLGQQVSLARRASARVAAALLGQGNPPVIAPVLDNPYLTEAAVLSVLRREELPGAVVEALAHHPKWSQRYDVRVQLVRHPLTPLAVALGFLPALKPEDLRVLVEDKSMNPALRDYLRAEVDRRLRRRHP